MISELHAKMSIKDANDRKVDVLVGRIREMERKGMEMTRWKEKERRDKDEYKAMYELVKGEVLSYRNMAKDCKH